MRKIRHIGIAAALSTACVGTMFAAAPDAFAVTPATVGAQQASVISIQPVDYQSGYKEGSKIGYSVGFNGCSGSSVPPHHDGDASTQRGFADGYRAGFLAARKQKPHCHG